MPNYMTYRRIEIRIIPGYSLITRYYSPICNFIVMIFKFCRILTKDIHLFQLEHQVYRGEKVLIILAQLDGIHQET